jgi:hypothetical protein
MSGNSQQGGGNGPAQQQDQKQAPTPIYRDWAAI